MSAHSHTLPGGAVMRLSSAPMTRMSQTGLLASAAVLPLAGVVGGVLRGSAGALGALAGAAACTAIFWLGHVALQWCLEKWPSGASMAAALAIYFIQMYLMFPLFLVLTSVTALDTGALGVSALVAAVAWLVGHVVGFVQGRTPAYDVRLPGEGA